MNQKFQYRKLLLIANKYDNNSNSEATMLELSGSQARTIQATQSSDVQMIYQMKGKD